MTQKEVVRIAGASGFWGDTALAVPQLLDAGPLDYLVFDYLAELTMSILAMQRAKDAASGYATDFVQIVMREKLLAIGVYPAVTLAVALASICK